MNGGARVGAIIAFLAVLLAVDTQVALPGQLVLGGLTWVALALALAAVSPLVRVQTLVVVAVATCGEIMGSIVWGVYTYRLENLPSFVPPAHGLVYLAGAAVRLGLIEANDLDDEETADLVELAADGRIADARSPLGRYVVRHWERVGLLEGESLVYWLRKLVFRGAWLDHRVKEGLLEVAWDEDTGDFGYAEPRGGRALLELLPIPSWHELQFRR